MDSQREHIVRLFPEINEIQDAELKERVIDAWLLALRDSQWERIEDLPWIPGRAEFISNVQHCRGVTCIDMGIMKAILNGMDVTSEAKKI